jgi:N-acetylmuramoyl-L-alanine amidase
MNKKIIIFLDPAHTNMTPGKRSPDHSLLEFWYSREIIKRIESKLDELGIKYWNTHPEEGWCSPNYATDSKDLQLRVKRVNAKYVECKEEGLIPILLSIHVNAAGNGGWYNATGWSAYTTKGKTKSDNLAECLYDAAKEVLKDKKIRTNTSDGDSDLESDFYIIKKSKCPAVLTENFFMDCQEDKEYLLSEEGKQDITNIHIKGILKYIKNYL